MTDILQILNVSRQFQLVLLIKVGHRSDSVGKCLNYVERLQQLLKIIIITIVICTAYLFIEE
jgi:hypothetical protein